MNSYRPLCRRDAITLGNKNTLHSHYFLPLHLCEQLLQTSLDGGGVGAADSGRVNLLAILEEEESGHGGDAVLGGDLGGLVDVDLVELDVLVGQAELLDLRGDGLAGAAPGGEEVDEDGLGGVDDLLVPLSLTVGFVSACLF
jgi:hypothetical protein